jgi:cellulase/cellobiase CelA1
VVDLRAALRPMVEQPATPRLPVAELAARARRRQTRRRAAAAGIAVSVVAVAGMVVMTHNPDARVRTVDAPPSSIDDTNTTDARPSTTDGGDAVPAPDDGPTSTPQEPSRSTPSADDEPFSPVAGIVVSSTTTSSWDHGHCIEIRVENTTAAPVEWKVRYSPSGTIAELWNAKVDDQSQDDVVFVGETWNERLPGHQWTTFGVCLDTA